jgi:hypothetical protein
MASTALAVMKFLFDRMPTTGASPFFGNASFTFCWYFVL